MPKQPFNLSEIMQLHQAGKLEEAKELYLAHLAQTPEDANARNQLALLYAEMGELDSAQEELEKAIAILPQEPIFHLHLANVLKGKGLFSQATDALKELIRQHPHYAAAYNNLGSAYFAQAKLNEAVVAFQQALANAPHYFDAYYNLGLTLTKLNKFQEACNAYRALLELSPQHAPARFQLASVLMQQKKYQEAIAEFNLLIEAHPHHLESITNIATSYLSLGQIQQAKMFYIKALEINAQDSQILFNLAVICMQQGYPRDAMEFYLRLLAVDPENFAAHQNLAIVYLVLKDKKSALNHFQMALRLDPNNRTIDYVIKMLMESKDVSFAPLEYIQSLFNAYANHYEAHLTQTLQYQVPQNMFDFVRTNYLHIYHAQLPERGWSILDLGCGTGLSGQMWRDYANNLIGVDLSPEMLKIAAQKHCYDKLVQADIVNFLQRETQSYNLIIAADVLVYFGDLVALFHAVYRRLVASGWFTFNIEVAHEPYQLLDTGRFAHSISYIKGCMESSKFRLVAEKTGFMRKQNDNDVYGSYFILTK